MPTHLPPPQLLNPDTAGAIYGENANVYVSGSMPLEPLWLQFPERRVYFVQLNDAYMWGPCGIPSTSCTFHASSIAYNVESNNFYDEHQFVGLETNEAKI